MDAKHRTDDPKKGGDHNCPPFGEPPSAPDLAKLRLAPLGSMHGVEVLDDGLRLQINAFGLDGFSD